MNEKKLKQLFESARREPSPAPPMDFATDVLRAVRQMPAAKLKEQFSIFDQLNLWFPRLALVAAAVIILSVAVDYGLTAAGLPELGDGTTQATSQFIFDTGNF
jgi:hypothetical protein